MKRIKIRTLIRKAANESFPTLIVTVNRHAHVFLLKETEQLSSHELSLSLTGNNCFWRHKDNGYLLLTTELFFKCISFTSITTLGGVHYCWKL